MRLVPKSGVDTHRAEEALAFAAGYGLVADDWQAEALTDWLLLTRSGIYACLTCGFAAPRQNGKNGIIEIRELYGMVALGEKFLHSAHEVKTARKAFKRLKHFFGEKPNDPKAKYPELNDLVAEVRSGNGLEAIVLADVYDDGGNFVRAGGSIEFAARSKGSGRGFTVDVIVIDEAQHLAEDELEAMLSANSAAPLGNPQAIFTGTPPNREKKKDAGEAWLRVRRDGLSGDDPTLCWTEYGAGNCELEDLDLDSRELLFTHNPAMGGRLQERVAKAERRRLSAAGYARERFGWWGPPEEEGAQSSLFVSESGASMWPKRKYRGQSPVPSMIGVAVSLDLAWTSIGAASDLSGERTCIGAVVRARGTFWVVDELKRMSDEHECMVAIDGRGPGAFLIPKLEEAAVPLVVLSTSDYLDACADLHDGITERGDVLHANHEDLNEAVDGGEIRYVGDRMAWGRKQSSSDVSMLEACTAAKWAIDHAPEVSVHNFGDLDLCDSCGENPHDDPDGAHDYLCPTCREAA